MSSPPSNPQSNEPAASESSPPVVNLSEISSSLEIKPIVKEVVRELEKTRSLYSQKLLFAGFFFFGVSIFLFLSLMYWLLNTGGEVNKTIFESVFNNAVDSEKMLMLYLNAYSAPLLLVLSALICISVGYVLLEQAGALVRTVIPKDDQDFLKSLNTQNEKGVDQYIKLTSLTGITGFFTKIGITGLPLATIVLTLAFGALALMFDQGDGASKFFDFASLTLGAFLGSYVQKKASDVAVKT